MLIAVTRTDCDLGQPNSCVECAVALALARATGFPWWVEPTRARPRVGPRDDWYALPPEAVAFVASYDAGDPVSEIEFSFGYEPAGRAA